MPKRSNDFQRLIALVEKLAASPTARVIESSELEEHPESSLREVDVLIEDSINGYPVTLAIECRDHDRAQDKTWIDQLYGKYRDLKVDTIVAVSSSGFTKGAFDKAAQVNIRAMTVHEALDEDWEEILVKRPHVKFIGHALHLHGISLKFGPDDPSIPTDTDFLDWKIEGPAPEQPRSVSQVVTELYGLHSPTAAEEYITTNRLRDASKPEDREFDFLIPFAVAEQVLIAPDGVRRALREMVLKVKGKIRFIDAHSTHVAYSRKVATIATLDSTETGKHTVLLVQHPCTDELSAVKWAYNGEAAGMTFEPPK